MKKIKLNLQQLDNSEVLTREQLKNILGGTGSGGDCQKNGDSCDTQKAINCCSGFKCAEWICRTATI
ncbi:MAG: TIGR04149 family rSAM-modified RiPP [Sediminibacterium sp.]|nr:TIGR04149 family rSAM-modified RiPP [Sediminibacterium sp.]